MTNKLLAVIIIISALLFGAVEVWSIAFAVFSVITLGLFWFLRGGIHQAALRPSAKRLMIVWMLFLFYSLLQTIPLPAAVVKLLSPSAWQSWSYYAFTPKGLMSVSLDPYKTSLELVKGLAAFTIFCMVALTRERSGSLRSALNILVIFGFALAVFGLIQKASWNGKIYWFRELTMGGSPFGPFVNKNHFAGFIGMLIPLGLGMSLSSRNPGKKVLFGFFSAIMVVSLFFSLSRGGIISFFSGIIVFVTLIALGASHRKKHWFFGLFFLLVAAYLLYLGIDPVISRFASTDVSTEGRLVVWSATLTAIKDYWLAGSGLGTFIHIFPLYAPPGLHLVFDHAHNDYLELLLESGIVGTGMVFVFSLLLLWQIIKAARSQQLSFLFIASLSGVAVMLVHNIFDFNLHILSNSMLFSFMLGLTALLSQPETQGSHENALKKTDIPPLTGEQVLAEYEHIAKGEFERPAKRGKTADRDKAPDR